MSGIKTTYTTVSTSELARIRAQAQRATTLEQANNVLNQLSSKNEAALNEYRNRITAMNNTINDLNARLAAQTNSSSAEVRDLRGQLSQVIKEGNDRLQELSRQNEARINAMNENFTNALAATSANLYTAIEQTRNDIATTIEENNRRVETQFQNVQARLNGIFSSLQNTAHNQATLLEQAREYYRVTQTLYDEIRTYRVDLLCPGRLDGVARSMESATREMDDATRMPENAATARREAREAMESAYQLYQDVVRAEQEWQLRYESVRQTLNATNAHIEACREIELEEEQGYRVNVDAWTSGDWNNLLRRADTLEEQLSKHSQELSLDDLEGIQEASVQINHEADDTAEFALEAFYASQDRAEIAYDIAEQLNEHGVSVIDYGYQGNDQRAAHRIHLRNNMTGFEIVVTQTPETDENGNLTNRLESDIINYGTRNAEEGDRIAREILSSLSGLGFEQTEVATTPGFENRASNRTEFANMNRWEREKPEVLRCPKKPETRNQ